MSYKIELSISDEMMEDWIEQISDDFDEEDRVLSDKEGLKLKLLGIVQGELQDNSLSDVDQYFSDYKFGKFFTRTRS